MGSEGLFSATSIEFSNSTGNWNLIGSGRGAGEFIILLGFVQCLQGRYLGSPSSSSFEAGVYGLIVPIEFPNGLYLLGELGLYSKLKISLPTSLEFSLSPSVNSFSTLFSSVQPSSSSAIRWLSKKGLHM